jgi:hypothetical protein
VYLLILETFVGSFLSSCLACLTATAPCDSKTTTHPSQYSVLSKRELPTTSVNKNYIAQKKKNAAKFKFVLKKGYRIG